MNTSLSDRSFAIYESILCAIRTSKKRPSKALLSKSLFENDIQVLETLAEGTGLEFSFGYQSRKWENRQPIHSIQLAKMKSIRLPASFSLKSMHLAMEEVDSLTDFCRKNGIESIATIDPMLLASGGLKAALGFWRTRRW